ncbi:MAG: glycoside hydrolase family 2 TIM barrel-domain containing protein [Terriglobia bacterium]|jgi:hypothetical protein
MINRREFVKLGSSALSSMWLAGDARALANPGGDPQGSGAASAAGGKAPTNAAWPRPTIVPLPSGVPGVSQPLIDLAGTWKLTTSPASEFWTNAVDPSGWTDITVPGELTAQGIPFARDNEFAYKRSVEIPTEAMGRKIVLRFDGVYSYARVWVNGKFVREHHGGFTAWDCDITDKVTPGQPAWITVGVTDRSDEISYASNYAKHYIGGILRSVRLVILPATHVSRLHVETDFDSTYKDARLRVMAGVARGDTRDVTLNLRLTDPEGKEITLTPSSLTLPAGKQEISIEVPVSSPVKWDCEHPNLYTLEAELTLHKSPIEKLVKKFGFRKVEVRKNKLYVNGDAIKLHGVCRHDTHPLWGRRTSPEQDEKDAILLRDANVNFVRTSHYPPTESFLEACDRHGIYVEEESAVCFVQQQWSVMAGGTESDPEYTSRYLNQFTEMIERDRSHPCVIFWSLGNESTWGTNFQKEHDYAKQADTTRPIIFSYPETVPRGVDCYDLFSKHYPAWNGNLVSKDYPKLNDEYAHVSCYNAETLKRDPGVRNYWGHSLKDFWENCYTADGCLGGAIWGGFDEVFLLPDGPVGYGEWGIIDGWRRPKPEYWLTKKAYSPVRIADVDVANLPAAGSPVTLPIKNWFNHTNLSELQIRWTVGKDSGLIQGLSLAPGQQGTLSIPGRAWASGEVLNLKFLRAGGILVDEFNLRLGARSIVFPAEKGPAPKLSEDAHLLTVQGPDFAVVFDKASGLISGGTFRGKRILEGGPILSLGSVELPRWWLSGMSYSTTSDAAVIKIVGAYMQRRGGGDDLGAEFEIRIDGHGLITTQYTVRSRQKGMSEMGIAFLLSSSISKLAWDGKALWSAYPPDHIGRPQGSAMREPNGAAESYRNTPQGPWAQDTKNFFLYGREDPGRHGTNDFRSLKENIRQASCLLTGSGVGVRVESDGTATVRAEVLADGRVCLHIANVWGYPDLDWGNYDQPITLPAGYKNTVRLRLTDTDES